jgi:biopolymer transport protein ExbD
MATIDNATGPKGRRPLRVDLTPMVDLGFLLITFFIFTNTLAEPTAMKLALPADSHDSMTVAKSGAITLRASQQHVQLLHAADAAATRTYTWQQLPALRQQLLHIRGQLQQQFGSDDQLFVLIQPDATAHYGQVVSLFDEMLICQVRRYSLVDAP